MSVLSSRLKSFGADKSGEIPTASPTDDFGVKILTVMFSKFEAALGATLNSVALSRYVFCRLKAYFSLLIFSASASLPDHFVKSKLADLNARLAISPFGSMAKVGIPCSAASSTMTLDNTVLPEPVAPSIIACFVSDTRSSSNFEPSIACPMLNLAGLYKYEVQYGVTS